jgi:hypothetical protein
MTIIKVREAEGRALDWLVCSCFPNASGMMRQIIERPVSYIGRYSSDAALAWPIMDREKIDIRHRPHPWNDVEATSRARSAINAFGPNALVAAMRCWVASVKGDEVDVPDELLAHMNREPDTAEDENVADASELAQRN